MWTLLAFAALLLLLRQWLGARVYWRRRGVPPSRPLPLVGDMLPVLLGKTDYVTWLNGLARPHLARGLCGAFQFTTPLLLLWDPDMVAQLLVKDFSSFRDRGVPHDPDGDPLSGHLFNLGGERWRRLRAKLTTTFTSGKLKRMLPLMTAVSEELSATVRADVGSGGGELDLHILLARFSTDVIGSCVFGVDCHSQRKRDDGLLGMMRQVAGASPGTLLRYFLTSVHPKLAGLVPLRVVMSKSSHFFLDLMSSTVQYRERQQVDRQDFVSLMMKLRELDRAEADPENRIDFTDGLMTAQAAVFFLAGLDTVANTVSVCLHHLALDTDLRSRAAEEVRNTIQRHGGRVTYEALEEMDLVGRIVMEGLRVWPAVGFLLRQCNSTTQLGDLTVERGQTVVVCVDVMHRDPNLFPDPDRFYPDRFTKAAKRDRHQYAYLPFGEGPRHCIAVRFAMLEMKLAVASLLNDFDLTASSRNADKPELKAGSFIPRRKNGFWVHLQPRLRT